MKNWNKTGKIKSLVILTLCFLSVIIRDFDGNPESDTGFNIGLIVVNFLFVVIFFPLSTKFRSLFGSKFEKPTWNENPITLKPSKSFNFFQFIAFWFMSAGFINVLLSGVLNQQFDAENAHLFLGGLSLLIGMKLSLKWLSKGESKKKTLLPTLCKSNGPKSLD